MYELFLKGIGETLIMTFASGLLGFAMGLPLGVVLFITRAGQIRENRAVNTIISAAVNVFRAIPFIILIVWMIPFTRMVVGTSIGVAAALVPLSVGAAPFIARMVENSLLEVPAGLVEASRAMGATPFQIVWKVLNVFQTRPFLEEQSAQRGYDFEVAGETFIYPMAAYSRTLKTIDELKEGGVVVIPNDATNGGRALLLLEHAGLIRLKPGRGYAPRPIDIESNPLRLQILELEGPQLPRALDDRQVSLAVINNSFAVKAGLFLSDGVVVEDSASPYVNLIVARSDNVHQEKVLQFVAAYQSDEVWAVAEKEFPGGVVRGNH